MSSCVVPQFQTDIPVSPSRTVLGSRHSLCRDGVVEASSPTRAFEQTTRLSHRRRPTQARRVPSGHHLAVQSVLCHLHIIPRQVQSSHQPPHPALLTSAPSSSRHHPPHQHPNIPRKRRYNPIIHHLSLVHLLRHLSCRSPSSNSI